MIREHGGTCKQDLWQAPKPWEKCATSIVVNAFQVPRRLTFAPRPPL